MASDLAVISSAWGGIDFESQGAGAVGPVPHRADLTQLNAPPGYMRTEHPLKRLHEGRG